jgi:hypothetical protein
MMYNRCTGIYKFGDNTYPRHIRRRSKLGHVFWGKKCVLWAGKYGNCFGEHITFDNSKLISGHFEILRPGGVIYNNS